MHNGTCVWHRFNVLYTLLLLVFLHKAITGVTDKVGNRTCWDWWKIVTKCKNINSNTKIKSVSMRLIDC